MLIAQPAFSDEMIIFDDRLPSLEFLEYLDDMVEMDGELVGPGELISVESRLQDPEPTQDSDSAVWRNEVDDE